MKPAPAAEPLADPAWRRSLWLGFAVAPLVAPITVSLYLAIAFAAAWLSDSAQAPQWGILGFSAAVALGVSLVATLPMLVVVHWLKARAALTRTAVCGAAALAGGVVLAGGASLIEGLRGPGIGIAVTGIALGAVSGLVFCRVVGVGGTGAGDESESQGDETDSSRRRR